MHKLFSILSRLQQALEATFAQFCSGRTQWLSGTAKQVTAQLHAMHYACGMILQHIRQCIICRLDQAARFYSINSIVYFERFSTKLIGYGFTLGLSHRLTGCNASYHSSAAWMLSSSSLRKAPSTLTLRLISLSFDGLSLPPSNSLSNLFNSVLK